MAIVALAGEEWQDLRKQAVELRGLFRDDLRRDIDGRVGAGVEVNGRRSQQDLAFSRVEHLHLEVRATGFRGREAPGWVACLVSTVLVGHHQLGQRLAALRPQVPIEGKDKDPRQGSAVQITHRSAHNPVGYLIERAELLQHFVQSGRRLFFDGAAQAVPQPLLQLEVPHQVLRGFAVSRLRSLGGQLHVQPVEFFGGQRVGRADGLAFQDQAQAVLKVGYFGTLRARFEGRCDLVHRHSPA